MQFLSTLSLRRATQHSEPNSGGKRFLSTLSLRRATLKKIQKLWDAPISIHALLAESDVSFMLYDTSSLIFLSTLSLRRATVLALCSCGGACDFYPRSPCGERRLSAGRESDTEEFLSTLSLRRATVGTIGQLQRRIGKFLSTLSLRRATRHEHYNPG